MTTAYALLIASTAILCWVGVGAFVCFIIGVSPLAFGWACTAAVGVLFVTATVLKYRGEA